MKLRHLIELSDKDSPMYLMGYEAFKSGISDTPNHDPNFKEHVIGFQRNFKGDVKTFGFTISKFKQNWIRGYKQASKDAGNEPFRMKDSSQSTASWLLKGHKRRKDKKNDI